MLISGPLREKFRKNLANIITLIGFLFTIWLLIVIVAAPERIELIVLLAILVGLTDFYDGKIARSFGTISEFGIAFDRLRDKLFICPVLLILAWRYSPPTKTMAFITFTQALAAGLVFIEFLLFVAWIIGIMNKLDASSNKSGKAKMFCEFLVVALWLVCLGVEKYFQWPALKFLIYFIDILLAATILLAIKSLEGYYQRYAA